MVKLVSKVTAEFAGTALLVSVVVGSGVMGDDLSKDMGVVLIINAFSTIFALALLILVLGRISGAHLNPAISLVQLFTRMQPLRETAAFMLAQITGAMGVAVGVAIVKGVKHA